MSNRAGPTEECWSVSLMSASFVRWEDLYLGILSELPRAPTVRV